MVDLCLDGIRLVPLPWPKKRLAVCGMQVVLTAVFVDQPIRSRNKGPTACDLQEERFDATTPDFFQPQTRETVLYSSPTCYHGSFTKQVF